MGEILFRNWNDSSKGFNVGECSFLYRNGT